MKEIVADVWRCIALFCSIQDVLTITSLRQDIYNELKPSQMHFWRQMFNRDFGEDADNPYNDYLEEFAKLLYPYVRVEKCDRNYKGIVRNIINYCFAVRLAETCS
jgi:hypothetical protein